MVFCPNCGKFNVDNATSCIHCGYNLLYPIEQSQRESPVGVHHLPPQQQITFQVTPVSPPLVITQQTILTFILGIITGVLLLVAVFVPWMSYKLYGTSMNYDVPNLVKKWGEFGYLYILVIFGALILIFSILLPFTPKIIVGDRTLFSKLILILSVLPLVINCGSMAHIGVKFSGENWSYSVGPFITITASILGILTGYFALKSAQTLSLPQQPYVICRRCGYQNESWRTHCQRCFSGLG